MVFCSNCGFDCGTAKFCAQCGNAVAGSTAPKAPPAPAGPPPSHILNKAPVNRAAPVVAPPEIVTNVGVGAFHGPSYGLSAEVNKKLASKYDPNLEADVTRWIEGRTGMRKAGKFADWLRSGVVLCKLVGAKYKDTNMAFGQMENIESFLSAARDKYHLRANDMFMTVDLFEEKNMTQVLQCLDSLHRAM